MADIKNNHTLEERFELSLLYDFYGALLKENQQRMFEASILEDYNLSEIADDEGITRQGVHDAIKRAVKQLRTYEDKLGLVSKFEKQKQLVIKLDEKLKDSGVDANNENWKEIFVILGHILED